MSSKYNVYAIKIDDGTRRIIASGKSERDAEAIVAMAVMRRGVETEYFVVEPSPTVATTGTEGDDTTQPIDI